MSRFVPFATAALLSLALSACSEDTTTRAADTPAGAPSAPVDVQPPAGYRFVGVGHAAIAVPESWARNKIRCGDTPEEDTYIVDVTAFATCASSRGKGLESVQLNAGEPRFDFKPDRTVSIDGVEAKQMDTTCTTRTMGNVETCSGSIFIPTEGVQFIAESSTNAAEVDAMLARIRVLPDQIAVPGKNSYSDADQERGGDTYVAALKAAGLRAETRTELRRGLPDGFILAVDPDPGTVARAGDVVTVTTAGGGSGPTDELEVHVNSHDVEGKYDTPSLTDEQVREGATLTLHVGDSMWAYGSGKYLESLAGTAEGSALRPSTWDKDPNKGRSWVAARPGTSTVTLTITVSGEKVEIGTFTVVVKPAR